MTRLPDISRHAIVALPEGPVAEADMERSHRFLVAITVLSGFIMGAMALAGAQGTAAEGPALPSE